MLRSVKYGLYGAVLAGMVGGTLAWTHVDRAVTLVVDGHASTVHTAADTVGRVVEDAGYHPGVHDILAPDATHHVHDGTKIIYKRGRLLQLNVDGNRTQVWTTAPTVAAALAQLGYSTADFTSVSRSKRLPLGVTDISVRIPKRVTVVHDGSSETVTTTDATVGQLLDDLDVTLGHNDRVSLATSAVLNDGAKVIVSRVVHKTTTVEVKIPFTTDKHNDSSMTKGQTKIVQAGKDGLSKVTYALVYIDGKLAGKTKISSAVLHKPTTKIVKVGTKLAPSAPAPSPGSAQAIAKSMVADRGWSSGQFDCLVTLWNHESGWNVHAANPSGAYGIPQALPGSKMSSAGPDWQNNATTQITWGLNYISSRYTTPCGAWSQWQANGGWY